MAFIVRETIGRTFLARIEATPDRVAFRSKVGTKWQDTTFRQFHEDCRLTSLGLMALGAQAGDRIGLLSSTRYAWPVCDLAILGAGAVTVPIYPSSPGTDIAQILNHSGCRFVIVEDAVQLEKTLAQKQAGQLASIEKIIVLEAAAMKLAAQEALCLSYPALHQLGRREEARDPLRFRRNLEAAKPDDLFTICYTSGTTGVPKGVMLKHDSMVSVLQDAVQVIGKHLRRDGECSLTFLPYSHVLGRVESLAIHTFAWTACFAESMDKLVTNFSEVEPTVLFAVPRVFEKAYARVQDRVAEAPAPLQKSFARALAAGRRVMKWEAQAASLLDHVEYQTARLSLFSKIREGFGGRLRFTVCGGAPLSQEIGEFFYLAGIRVLEGYGLTETCAPVTLNDPVRPRFGSVGKPLPEVQIRIAPDGEIMIKSRKVFAGYYRADRETAEAFSDGWFLTGDIGRVEADGTLTITDRKKDLIITSGGKNVAPQKLENLAHAQKIFSHFVVYGDRKPYLSALITLDRETIIRYASENQILFSEYAELVKHPKILILVQRAIDDLNAQLPGHEKIKKFAILPVELTVEAGELTPSLKVKRKVLTERFRPELDALYAP